MSWYIIRQCDSNFKPFKNVKVTVISWVNFSRIFEKWQQFSRLGIMMECPVFLPSCLLAYCRFSATLKLNNNKLKTMIFLDLHDILRKFWVYKKKGLKLFFFFLFFPTKMMNEREVGGVNSGASMCIEENFGVLFIK